MTTNERLAKLEERVEHIIIKIDDIRTNHLTTIYNKLDKLSHRPTWIITVIITFLSCLVVALLRK